MPDGQRNCPQTGSGMLCTVYAAVPREMKEVAAYFGKQVLREVSEDEFYKNLENEMLKRVNELHIGPQGFGGEITALAVNIETAPTHIAGLPVAVNVGCHVTRHCEVII